jgi:hypothetical protein
MLSRSVRRTDGAGAPPSREVNFAGLRDGAGIAEIDEAAWDLVNLKGGFLCQTLSPAMIAQRSEGSWGRSPRASPGSRGGPYYSAAKGRIISLGGSWPGASASTTR